MVVDFAIAIIDKVKRSSPVRQSRRKFPSLRLAGLWRARLSGASAHISWAPPSWVEGKSFYARIVYENPFFFCFLLSTHCYHSAINILSLEQLEVFRYVNHLLCWLEAFNPFIHLHTMMMTSVFPSQPSPFDSAHRLTAPSWRTKLLTRSPASLLRCLFRVAYKTFKQKLEAWKTI